MGNNPAQRERERAARLEKSKQDTHDLLSGLAGVDVPSVWGQIGKGQSRFNKSPQVIVTPPVSTDLVVEGGDGHTGGRRPTSESRPWFPFVDEWVKNAPAWLFAVLAMVGGMCGFIIGLSSGGLAAGVLFGLVGGAIGPVLIFALAQGFKLLLGALAVAGVLLGAYAVIHLLGGHLLGGH